MLCLKKLYTDDLLQLALLLSLLRVDPNSYLGLDVPAYNVGSLALGNMSGWFMDSPIIRPQYVHPKNLDNMLLNYERQMFEDLNALGRFNRVQNYNVTAYLLNVDQDRDYQNMTIGLNSTASAIEPTASALVPSTRSLNISDVVTDSAEAVAESEPTEEAASTIKVEPDDSDNDELSLNHPPDPFNSAELTQEDMDLIEVLWKQDVDLGFSLEANAQNTTDTVSVKSEQGSTGCGYRVSNSTQKPTISNALSTTSSQSDDEEKLKALEAINSKQLKSEDPEEGEDGLDPWARFSYTIDTETGEYVLKSGLGPNLPPEEDTADDLPLDGTLAEFLLEEALQLVGLDDDCPQDVASAKEVESSQSSPSQPEASVQEAASSDNATGFTDPDDDEILKMIQTAQFHHGHPRAFQGHMPFMHMNMEQHWQDLANLLSLPAGESAAAASAHHAHHALSAAHHAHHAAAAHALHHHHGYGHVHHAHPVGYGAAPAAPDTRGVLLHNATLAPPVGDLNSTTPYHNNLGGTNLGSAVATSMNLTNSSEPINDSGTPSYKLENPHDMMYYPNTSSEINSTSDGFLSSILNDEDLQLMDMAMNEGMYTMRMLDGGNSTLGNAGASSASNRVSTDLATALTAERMDASSDSAVSSMGSERVPSLSDGEWCDAASDSGHTTADHYALDYASGYSNKYRPYDYSYNSRQHSNNIVSSDSRRMPAVAQKKHQMFGKRFFQEQGGATSLLPSSVPVKYEYPEVGATSSFGNPSVPSIGGPTLSKNSEVKYSCTMEFGRHLHGGTSSLGNVQHNHTYSLPPESSGTMQRPLSRDKSKEKYVFSGKKSEEEPHLTRDEKKARALNVPLTVDDIINLPMDEFNERLSKYDLSETQLSLIRDIRRRGKNKVAAQNCRKRKLDQILSLADEVKDMKDRKIRLLTEREFMLAEKQRVKEKFAQLYRHVFQHLRDPEGNLYSPTHYSLQQSADGSVLVVPRNNSTMQTHPDHKDPNNCKEQQ